MEGPAAWIDLCSGPGGMQLRAKVPLSSEAKSSYVSTALVDIRMKTFEDFIIAYPLDGRDDRLVYVHKVAGIPVAKGSSIQFGKHNKHDLENASAGLDWTKGKLLYRTFWRWVSLNDARADVVRGSNPANKEYVGINLSQDVYDVQKSNGQVFSAENGVWVMGRLYPLQNPVEITVPANPRKDLWKIKSTHPTEEEDLDLLFRPLGARADNTSLGFVVSDFIQPYGRFSGTIKLKDQNGQPILVTLRGDTAFGVVENHKAFW